MSKPTIRDVAALADVSVATVSAVINDSRYVSPELTERVESAVERLSYKPDSVARSLSTGETKSIALVFSNAHSPIWPPLVRGAQRVAQEAGFDTFLITTDENFEVEKRSLDTLLSKRVDGVIVAPAFTESYEHLQDTNRNVPVIAIERSVPGIESVVTDNEEISFRAVNHLIDHGYKRIGLVTIPLQGINAAYRFDGYRRALLENDLYDPDLVRETDFAGRTSVEHSLELILEANVDAIFATSESTTIGVLQSARQVGRRIPDDLALFGYDEVAWMDVAVPPLSTVCQPSSQMSTLATRLLLERIKGREPSDKVHILESNLIIRQSCGCRP